MLAKPARLAAVGSFGVAVAVMKLKFGLLLNLLGFCAQQLSQVTSLRARLGLAVLKAFCENKSPLYQPEYYNLATTSVTFGS